MGLCYSEGCSGGDDLCYSHVTQDLGGIYVTHMFVKLSSSLLIFENWFPPRFAFLCFFGPHHGSRKGLTLNPKSFGDGWIWVVGTATEVFACDELAPTPNFSSCGVGASLSTRRMVETLNPKP